MPARRKRAGKFARRAMAKKATAKVMSLCFDMEEPLTEAIDTAHTLRLIGQGLSESANASDARAVASTAWRACESLEALQRIWDDLFKAAARASS